MKRGKVVVVGSSNTDLLIKSDRFPSKGETVIGGDFVTAAGGKGANQAVAAARLGAEVFFVARVGDDVFGRKSIEGFKTDGINCEHVSIDPDFPSGVAMIHVDKAGENRIVVALGANLHLTPEHVSSAREAIESADVLLVQLEVPIDTVESVAKIAFNAGVRVVLNPAPGQLLSDELLRCVSVLTPNETEAEILTGAKVREESDARAAAETLRARGAESVIFTLGSNGSYVASAEGFQHIAAHKMEAVDSTAAGDAFSGALAVALARGSSLIKAAQFASVVAAISVTRLGAQPSLPTGSEVDVFLGSAGL